MTFGYRRWFMVSALLGVVGLVLAGTALAAGDISPRGYISHHYTRSAKYDLVGGSRAYTSPKSVSRVAAEVTRAWRPADRYTDFSGVYLRYSDDLVTVQPRSGGGSVIRVEGVRSGYNRYRSTVGSHWGWSTSSSEGNRGGGPGAGK